MIRKSTIVMVVVYVGWGGETIIFIVILVKRVFLTWLERVTNVWQIVLNRIVLCACKICKVLAKPVSCSNVVMLCIKRAFRSM